MKPWQWVIVVAPLMVMSGTILQGCTMDMCPTEEQKAAGKANEAEVAESEDCLGDEQESSSENSGGYGGMPGFNPQWLGPRSTGTIIPTQHREPNRTDNSRF
jgi:hypothetical protein